MPATGSFKPLFVFVLMFLKLNDMAIAQDFKKIFSTPYKQANKSAERIRPRIKRLAFVYNEDSRIIESVIFPELMRYNEFYDVVETGSLMSLYTTFGQDYSDFSIGMFQMKPSFALSLETLLNSGTLKKWADQMELGKPLQDTYKDRSKRID
ncbi:MAG TPA: hypothetical protein VKB19_11920, partial [Pedobacter sp.]|nr:hypothetical protein [Pedobacter sp.]